MIPLGYLEMLHANHEDWLHEQSVSAEELARHPMLHAEGAYPPCKRHSSKVERSCADAGLADCCSQTGHSRRWLEVHDPLPPSFCALQC